MSKIIIYILVLISFPVISQDISKLIEYENRIFYEKNDTTKNSILLEKFIYSIKSGQIDSNSIKTGKRIDLNLISEKEERARFLWNMSLLSLLNNELNFSSYYESMYYNETKDTSYNIQLLNFFIYKNDQSRNQKFIKNLVQFDSIFNGLNCINSIEQDEEEFSRYVRYSKLLPGLGSFLLGEKRKGITSFLINGLTTYAVFELIKNQLYINAIGFTLVYWLKFYQGNSYLTEDIIHQKISQKENDLANECEVIYHDILTKYPLYFR